MKTTLLKSLCIIALSYCLGLSSQTTNLNPIKDNSIYSENNNSNGLGNLFVGRTGGNNGNNNRRALIQFDLSSIPSGATITSVSLTVNVNKTSSSGSGTQTYTIYGLTKEWGEGTSSGGGTGGMAIEPDATWINAMLGTSTWSSPGGDYNGSPMSTVGISGTGTYTFASTTNFISVAQNWLNTPSMNHGLILIGDESVSNSSRQFGSKDGGVAPTLSVTYSTLSTVDFSLNDFSIYPNPAKNLISLSLPKNVTEASVNVYDVLGKKVYHNIISNEEQINVSDLNKGIYLLEVSSSGNIKTKRFVKL